MSGNTINVTESLKTDLSLWPQPALGHAHFPREKLPVVEVPRRTSELPE